MSEVITNGLLVTASAAYGAGVTAIVVTPPTSGPAIPPLYSGDSMRCLWDNELINVTLTSGTGNVNWTIARAQEGTVAAAHLINSQIFQVITVAGIQSTIGTTLAAGVPGDIKSLLSLTVVDQTAGYTNNVSLFRRSDTVFLWDSLFGLVFSVNAAGASFPSMMAGVMTATNPAGLSTFYQTHVWGPLYIYDDNLSGTYFEIVRHANVVYIDVYEKGHVVTIDVTTGVWAFLFGMSLPITGAAIAGNVTRKVAQAFTSQTTLVVTHNLGTVDVHVQVFNTAGVLIAPTTVTTTSINVVTITFGSSTSGRVVVIG